MKAKSGFVLRNVMGDHLLMPTGENLGAIGGYLLLNGVSAFIWEKLQQPISRDALLAALLDEFEVEEAVAAADLDSFLAKLQENGMLAED